VTLHTLRDGEPRISLELKVSDDKLSVVLLAPADEYAVIIGQIKPLSIYVVDLDSRRIGKREKVIVEASSEYSFNSMYDAASVLAEETLLISYRKGYSVTFDLAPALKSMRLG
jgi:hypothetical protein